MALRTPRARTVLAAVAALAVAVIVVPSCLPLRDAVKDGPGVEGVYVLNGIDASGAEYAGTVDIRNLADGGVALQWVITGGIQAGRGTVEGDQLIATWRTVSDPRGPATGSARYTIAADGSMSGTRTVDGVEGVATEELFLEP